MKNKIFYPAFALLLFANILAFCTKEPETAPVVAEQEFVEFDDFSAEIGLANDRNNCCVFISSPGNNVKVCGTQENSNACSTCPGWITLTGTEGPSTYVDFCVQSDAYFTISHNQNVPITVYVGNTPVSLVAYTIPANSKRRFKSENANNCAIVAGGSCAN